MRNIRMLCYLAVIVQIWACGGNSPDSPPSTGACPLGYVTLEQDRNHPCSYQCTKTLEEDHPDANFTDEDCDGIDGNLHQAVFVDGSLGSDDGDGSINHPIKTIRTALQVAATQKKTELYLSEATYQEKLDLVSGISLYGKYSRVHNWQRISSAIVKIQSDPAAVGDQIAVHGASIDQKTVLADLQIQAGDVSSAYSGHSSYGLRCFGCTALEINRVQIFAGKGAPGVSGRDGLSGRPGGNGNDPIKPSTLCSMSRTKPPITLLTLGGSGGTSPVGTFGGAGGRGGAFVSGLENGRNGQNGSGGAPGGIGAAAAHVGFHGTVPSAGPGENGFDGAVGAYGEPGLATKGFISLLGDWVSDSGEAADDGGNGQGGGGGGGSGAFTYQENIFASSFYALGAPGGGGGGGGEGGTGGLGGTGGGGSFGIYAIHSPGIMIQDVRIQSGQGGTGGDGGKGGSGGKGGALGLGFNYCAVTYPFDPAVEGYLVSAHGGAGGSGGFGGEGGGGAGGPSFAIFTEGFPVTMKGKNILVYGAGGQGGSSAGFSGEDGLSGQIHDQ